MPAPAVPLGEGRQRRSGALAASQAAAAALVLLYALARWHGSAERWVESGIYAGCGALCAARARSIPGKAPACLFVGAALLLWAAAALVDGAAVGGPGPTTGAWLWLASFAPLYAGLVVLLRLRVARLRWMLALDGVAAVLALGAVAAVVATESVAVGVAGGLCCVLSLILAAEVVRPVRWRPDPGLGLMLLAFVVAFAVEAGVIAAGPSHPVGVGWVLVAVLLTAAVLWPPPAGPAARKLEGHSALVLPAVCGSLAAGVLIYGNFATITLAASVTAAVALGLAVTRVAAVLRESWALHQLSRQDALTGLLNHREFHTAIAAEIASANGFAVVIFDLDGFKAVNDTHGHAAGDRVLRRVADAMRQAARTSDVVCRVGGDELAFVLPEGSEADGEAVGARVRARVLALDAEVDVSFGVAEWPADGPTKEMLLLRADVALYAAKSTRSTPRAPDPEPAARASEGDDRAQLRAYARDVRTGYTREIRRTQELRDSYLATVRTLSAAFEAKEDDTGGHIHRVHELGLLLARKVVPDEADDPQLAYGFLLHDIGKLAVPDAVLTKPDRLTAEEWALMHGHPEAGHRMLAGIPFLRDALDVVLHHHERWDGRGYPNGLSGRRIPMWARIFAVVDTVDAIVSEHAYRPGRPLGEAVGEVLAGAGSQFDPGCAAAFAALDPRDVEAALQHVGGVYPRRITGTASASAGTERSGDGRPRR